MRLTNVQLSSTPASCRVKTCSRVAAIAVPCCPQRFKCTPSSPWLAPAVSPDVAGATRVQDEVVRSAPAKPPRNYFLFSKIPFWLDFFLYTFLFVFLPMLALVWLGKLIVIKQAIAYASLATPVR